jgi:hypothetical protein
MCEQVVRVHCLAAHVGWFDPKKKHNDKVLNGELQSPEESFLLDQNYNV